MALQWKDFAILANVWDSALTALRVTGTVTIDSMPAISVGSVSIKNDTDATGAKVGGGVEANALRVTIATDSTGLVSVDDNGQSLTVDGTFWQATQPVSIATAPVLVAGTALIGKVGIDQTTPGTTNAVVASKPSVTQVVSTALEASKVLKNAAGSLVSLTVTNTKASSQWILVMNSTTVPADGAVTLLYPPIPIAAQSMIVIDWDTSLVASTGIAVSNSSTGTFTKTIGSADCVFHAQVI